MNVFKIKICKKQKQNTNKQVNKNKKTTQNMKHLWCDVKIHNKFLSKKFNQ